MSLDLPNSMLCVCHGFTGWLKADYLFSASALCLQSKDDNNTGISYTGLLKQCICSALDNLNTECLLLFWLSTSKALTMIYLSESVELLQ